MWYNERTLKKIPSENYVSLSTLLRWGFVEPVSVEKKIEYSLEELLDTINSIISEDYYDCDGDFDCDGRFITENGKIFYVRYFQKYRFK